MPAVTGGRGDPDDPDDPVAVVRRWEESGSVWRVLAQGPRGVTVGLFQCSGGELVQQVRSGDPQLLAYLAGRTSSED